MTLYSIEKKLTQDADCCDSNDYQTLTVSTACSADPAKDSFIIIETKRWSIDPSDIDAFCAMLKDTLKEVTE